MAQWQNKLDLADLWKARKNGEITISELGKGIAKRIKKSLETSQIKHFGTRQEIENIADDFEYVTDDVEDFDEILGRLYDWADTSLDGKVGGKKMCWVSTFLI